MEFWPPEWSSVSHLANLERIRRAGLARGQSGAIMYTGTLTPISTSIPGREAGALSARICRPPILSRADSSAWVAALALALATFASDVLDLAAPLGNKNDRVVLRCARE